MVDEWPPLAENKASLPDQSGVAGQPDVVRADGRHDGRRNEGVELVRIAITGCRALETAGRCRMAVDLGDACGQAREKRSQASLRHASRPGEPEHMIGREYA